MAGLPSGTEFAGYVVEDVLSRGGMGVVYRATELRPQRTVALKVIAPELAAESQFRTRFLQESQLAAAIEHPHVVPVLRVGEEDGLLFIAMRLIRGRDLATIIGVDHRLEPKRISGLVDQVADALDTAHGMGLVHRDVKPANVLVERHRRGEHAYLTDFGLTKAFASTTGVTSTGVVVGTVDYMAPEQLEGGSLDARTDVYSLGCVLFQGLTGTVPFPRENRAARMYAHMKAPPPSVSEVVPGVPQEFDEVVRRALAKDPDSRYPSAGNLARAAMAATERHSPSAVVERSVATGEAAPAGGTPVAGPPMVQSGESARAGAAPPAAGRSSAPDSDAETTPVQAGAGTGTTAYIVRETREGPPGGRRRRRPLAFGASAAALAVLIAVLVVLLTGHGEASASDVATKWLRLHESGNEGQAAALWKAPVTYGEAFPAATVRFGTVNDVRKYWAARPCQLALVRTLTASGNVVVLRVLAQGERIGGGNRCSSNGTMYDDRFTVQDGHIVGVVSVLAPMSAVQTWLRMHDAGDDRTASTLWAPSASVTTVDPRRTTTFNSVAAVAAWWAKRGCELNPLGAPFDQGVGAVMLHVVAAQRPHVAEQCHNIGTHYDVLLTVSSGHIARLVFTQTT